MGTRLNQFRHGTWPQPTLLILRLTAECPVARTGSMENLPEGSWRLSVKMELMPVSVSFTSMLRLASGVPKGTFSWMVTLYSAWLKVGTSSLTSLMVMVREASELVVGSPPAHGVGCKTNKLQVSVVL